LKWIGTCFSSVQYTEKAFMRQGGFIAMSVTNDMSGFVAHDLSGLLWSSTEVTDEADRVSGGEPEDAIRRGLFGVEREPVDAGDSSPGLGCK
jgi:hypothetical protein